MHAFCSRRVLNVFSKYTVDNPVFEKKIVSVLFQFFYSLMLMYCIHTHAYTYTHMIHTLDMMKSAQMLRDNKRVLVAKKFTGFIHLIGIRFMLLIHKCWGLLLYTIYHTLTNFRQIKHDFDNKRLSQID